VILAVSLVEDGLPGLNRQVYYRCLERGDNIDVDDDHVDVMYRNHPTATDPASEPWATIIWRISFNLEVLDGVRSFLEDVSEGHWRFNHGIFLFTGIATRSTRASAPSSPSKPSPIVLVSSVTGRASCQAVRLPRSSTRTHHLATPWANTSPQAKSPKISFQSTPPSSARRRSNPGHQ
ncbi:hypothetical protein C8A05DRAFT_20205, partial [Staphylotrichum tortipilum]